MPGEGAGQAVRLGGRLGRRSATLPGRRADPGPAGGAGGADLAVVPAQSSGGESGVGSRSGTLARHGYRELFAVRASRNATAARANLVLANRETDRANEAARNAVNEARRADLEAQHVREEKHLSDRRLYVAEINLAQQA